MLKASLEMKCEVKCVRGGLCKKIRFFCFYIISVDWLLTAIVKTKTGVFKRILKKKCTKPNGCQFSFVKETKHPKSGSFQRCLISNILFVLFCSSCSFCIIYFQKNFLVLFRYLIFLQRYLVKSGVVTLNSAKSMCWSPVTPVTGLC